jgi:glutamine amidotransferase
MMLRALVIHYGVGNVFSVSHALRRLGFEVVVSEKPLEGFDCLVMPGVGSFSAAAENVAGYRRELVDLVRSGLPVLGICLGMQLLFESSDEGPGSGLGVFSGRVVGFPRGVKSPHMGWNRLVKVRDTPLLEGVDEGWVYFNHSYYPSPGDRSVVIAKTLYGVEFPSAIGGSNVYGTQFHPEKSSKTGRAILENFKKLVRV